MKPRITYKFSKKNFEAAAQTAYAKFLQIAILRFQRIGEQFIVDAKNGGDYDDQTGNLRSSIGYIVGYLGNEVVHEIAPGKGKEGPEAARKLLRKILQEHPSGLCLIVCAGMQYALFLESKGRDVISSSAINMKQGLLKLFLKNKRNY